MRRILFLLFLVAFVSIYSLHVEAADYIFKSLAYPFPDLHWCQANDIDGGNILGYYQYPLSGRTSGFLYDGTTWISFDYNGFSTYPWGIDGDNIVGYYFGEDYKYHGFLYNYVDETWTPLDYPYDAEVYPEGINGGNIVGELNLPMGSYIKQCGFLLADSSWTLLDPPDACGSYATGIGTRYIVGTYLDSTCLNVYGFIYDISTETYDTLPGYPGAITTIPYKIDRNRIVGWYYDAIGNRHGFFFDRTSNTWTTLDYPGAISTDAHGISGNNIVGRYEDATGVHGFLATPLTTRSLLEFLDKSVSDGSLIGSGPGKSANNRLDAFRNMIEVAAKLIEDGTIAEACQQFMDAYKKTDGDPRPPDFVAGKASPELARGIRILRAGLGCP